MKYITEISDMNGRILDISPPFSADKPTGAVSTSINDLLRSEIHDKLHIKVRNSNNDMWYFIALMNHNTRKIKIEKVDKFSRIK